MARDRQVPVVSSVEAQKAIVANLVQIYESPNWVPNEREVAAEVVKELENRRALYNDYELEIPEWVIQSVLQMRQFFHEKLRDTRVEGALANHLRAMRAACRKFLDVTRPNSAPMTTQDIMRGGIQSWQFCTALGEFRSTVGLTLGLLMAAYGLSCEPQLARILPADPTQGD